jgi:hypothetical protein
MPDFKRVPRGTDRLAFGSFVGMNENRSALERQSVLWISSDPNYWARISDVAANSIGQPEVHSTAYRDGVFAPQRIIALGDRQGSGYRRQRLRRSVTRDEYPLPASNRDIDCGKDYLARCRQIGLQRKNFWIGQFFDYGDLST